jgi:2,5-dioxopentanoate dehydrogenase
MLSGKHLIAGAWVGGEVQFASVPASGPSHLYAEGTASHVDAACIAAEDAFPACVATSREDRARFLDRIADEIEARGADITAIGSAETGLPPGRLESERGRTTGQLRKFAEHIRKSDYLDLRHDAALPDRLPFPRPDIRMMQMPVGPVAVFGASNFPLAFSVAGGDTASALAAGCPVVVKGHSAHPGTGEIVAQAVIAAILACKMPPGVFSLVQGGSRTVGQALVTHPLVRAVGFTGSLIGGRALFDLCAARPSPIPFFGELGSINPVFVLPEALAQRGDQIARDWAASLVMGAGQFCTNPGIIILPDGQGADGFQTAAAATLTKIAPQTMLTPGMAQAYDEGAAHMAGVTGVRPLVTAARSDREASPSLFTVNGGTWLSNPTLAEEVFGPLGLIVRVQDDAEMLRIATALHGQLTCTLHLELADHLLAQRLLPVLARKAGRIVVNGFPTGVEVCDAMVHGGPYPASTNFGATSVGTLSIRRWLRPVAYQNMPVELLPKEIQQVEIP